MNAGSYRNSIDTGSSGCASLESAASPGPDTRPRCDAIGPQRILGEAARCPDRFVDSGMKQKIDPLGHLLRKRLDDVPFIAFQSAPFRVVPRAPGRRPPLRLTPQVGPSPHRHGRATLPPGLPRSDRLVAQRLDGVRIPRAAKAEAYGSAAADRSALGSNDTGSSNARRVSLFRGTSAGSHGIVSNDEAVAVLQVAGRPRYGSHMEGRIRHPTCVALKSFTALPDR